jgi:hypothetical protein
MSRPRDVRERWITEVLRTDAINDGCKLVLIAMSRHMTDAGRVSYPRERIAAEVGLKTPQRVTNRIKEARDAGLIDVVHSGYRGMTAVYEAMLPAPKKGAHYEHPIGRKGTGSGHPFSGTLSTPLSNGEHVPSVTKGARSEHPNAGARVRGTKTSREQEPTNDGSRVVGEADPTSTDSNYGDEWLPTPSTSFPSSARSATA